MTTEQRKECLELVDALSHEDEFVGWQERIAATQFQLRALLTAPKWTYTEEGLPEGLVHCWFVVRDRRECLFGYRRGETWYSLSSGCIATFHQNCVECWLPVTVPEMPEERK